MRALSRWGPSRLPPACGKILGLDENGLHNALGIAFCRSTVAGNSTVAPSLSKRLGVGFAAQSGVIAALLARADFPAAGEVFRRLPVFSKPFTSRKVIMPSCSINSAAVLKSFWLDRSPFPSCRYTHCAVTACLSLLHKYSIKAHDIQEIRVQVGERDMRSVGGWSEDEKKKKHHPEGVVDAQFSIPYTVAATLVSGGLSLEEFTDVKLRSEEILDLADAGENPSHP